MSRIIIEKDLEIPMRDGCVLKADLYRPDGPEKLPVLLNRTPYDKSFPPITLNTLDVVRAARSGYNVVVQDCRGLFASHGTFRCFSDEARDGYDTIEYLAHQPFADGQVGTFGASTWARRNGWPQPSAHRVSKRWCRRSRRAITTTAGFIRAARSSCSSASAG